MTGRILLIAPFPPPIGGDTVSTTRLPMGYGESARQGSSHAKEDFVELIRLTSSWDLVEPLVHRGYEIRPERHGFPDVQ